MPKLTTDQARDLSRAYYGLATTIGEYRFDQWDVLSPGERARLESDEWTLLTQSSDMTTRAIVLAVDDVADAVSELTQAADGLTAALGRINAVKRAFAVAAAAVTLGAALLTGHPAAIAEALAGALDAAQDDPVPADA